MPSKSISATQHRPRKHRAAEGDSAVGVVRAFSKLIKRRGSISLRGTATVAADGTIGDGPRAPIAPSVDTPPTTKSKRQHLDEKARAYSDFCRSRC